MNLVREGLASGSTVIDGYKVDGRFVPVDAIPQYQIFEFQGHEENSTTQFSFVVGDYDLELVSVYGGYIVGANQEIYLTDFRCQLPAKVAVNYPENLVFSSNFGKPLLPFSFPKGILLPAKSKCLINFSSSCSFLRLVTLPVLPIVIGNIINQP
jgi:hypothetical protein